ncbi:DUF4160 domain-containing protein [Rhizobium sp. G21]|uniref:DUF4160 domain-containing protein n=1 Tax=Rhizobium sp. G21 TaxID=2758439 RepID=UPI0016042CE4|nr:DUF4160 domain-containing protein [Rhizobium sp. G21]MBB1248509.1 DUF4160 domain-containing protein [Rhizobium sp. G21]
MFADDHHPPHLHIVSPDGQALVDLKTLSVLRGDISRGDLETVLRWARGNREALEREWKRLNER